MKEFVCYREGERQLGKNSYTNEDGGDKRRRGITRESCKARLRVTKSKLGNHYIVSIFEEEHNHPLATTRKVGLLRSHRQVSEVKKCLMQQFSLANISTHQQMSVLELQAGGLGSIGHTERDICNEQSRVRRMLDGHDAELLYKHFLAKKESNSLFEYVFEADSNGKLKHVFWADAAMRMAYSYYGDVIVFDTTYNTNRYGMIFTPILGVNNHGKTVTFSCAFFE
ncbi:hypothetical protein J5N97_001638 [Dioscorea zingiberensis]|uniref:Protein FAR1-RELATED SEQUENCE n=1 Tax=Dioscorea zingiberensis TaxID=325984 RepID=A0A9D5BTN9_9LILI|nr:hypothetical protein J5N97_001638 [Dioscorea zingiberensis]